MTTNPIANEPTPDLGREPIKLGKSLGVRLACPVPSTDSYLMMLDHALVRE